MCISVTSVLKRRQHLCDISMMKKIYRWFHEFSTIDNIDGSIDGFATLLITCAHSQLIILFGLQRRRQIAFQN